MKFINVLGEIVRGTRQASVSDSIREHEVSEPRKLTEFICSLARRITSLESLGTPKATEFEVNVGSGGAQVTLTHRFDCPVRYTVVHWGRQDGMSIPSAGPALVMDSSSDSNRLVLNSYVSGKAVIRVEPSQFMVKY